MSLIRSSSHSRSDSNAVSAASRLGHAARISAVLSLALASCGLDPDDDTAAPDEAAAASDLVDPAAADPTSYQAALTHPAYVRTPAGLKHRDCVTELSEDATIADDGTVTRADGRQDRLGPCSHPSFAARAADARVAGAEAAAGEVPSVNGWIIASWWDAPTWVRRLYENFTVPANPAANGAVVFLFPSFEGIGGSGSIVQPVLQWGNNGAFGGNYWTIASWYVWGSNSVHSAPIRVRAGDFLWGGLEASDCQANGTHCSWMITTRSRDLGRSTAIRIRGATQYRSVQGGVLEVYDLTGCDQLPASRAVRFAGLQVFNGALHRVPPNLRMARFDTLCRVTETDSATATTISWSSF